MANEEGLALRPQKPPPDFLSSGICLRVFREELQILLVQKNEWGSPWVLPGGTSEEKEGPRETGAREIEEEALFTLGSPNEIAFLCMLHKSKYESEETHPWFLFALNGQRRSFQRRRSKEVSHPQWFSLADVLRRRVSNMAASHILGTAYGMQSLFTLLDAGDTRDPVIKSFKSMEKGAHGKPAFRRARKILSENLPWLERDLKL